MTNRYYFTFGRDEQFPYQDGWVVVEAETASIAAKLFSMMFPNPRPGCENIMNCSFMYPEKDFIQTEMYRDGENFGHGCHKVITMSIKDLDGSPAKPTEEPIVVIDKEIDNAVHSIGLTRHEAFLAYEAYEHACDVETVESKLRYCINVDPVLLKKKDEIAYEMRRQINKYDMDEDDAFDAAIENVTKEG